MNIIWFFIIILAVVIDIASPIASAQLTKKRFTIADEIGLALFDDPGGGPAEVLFSPDGNYFVAKTECGRLDINRVEDTVRFYRSEDVKTFLDQSEASQPSPVWTIARTGKEGGIVGGWRWLADSSGVAFLERLENGNKRLVLADHVNKRFELLTLPNENVMDFDVRDRRHYVYTIADSVEAKQWKVEYRMPAVVGTGHSLYELLLPDDPISSVISLSPRYRNRNLRAVIGSEHLTVTHHRVPLTVFDGSLRLSPDGRSVATTLPVPEIPSSWETLYPPPFASSHYRIHAGRQNVQNLAAVLRYVRIDLETGGVQDLTGAPTSNDAGWWANGSPDWSSDGQQILLPNTFLISKDNVSSRPCVAIVDLPSNMHTCVEVLKGHTETGVEEGYHFVTNASFVGGNKQQVRVTFIDHQDQSYRTTEYQHTSDNTWRIVVQTNGAPDLRRNGLEITVRQGLNEPPELIAVDKQASRVIWDPNPQVKDIELSEATVYTWKDKEGKTWEGGLYKPPDYKSGQRYPLVIQTHGFSESKFRPSGVFPTAFAARALAATGVMVLQVAASKTGGCPLASPEEAPCNVSMIKSAANALASQGQVDPERIGIIGFSRTCFHVLETLTSRAFSVKAASVTDGVVETYSQHLLQVGTWLDLSPDSDAIMGAKPVGAGLQKWLKLSPGFNTDRITAPLLIVAEGPVSLLLMWEPYAGLRYLHKPVDLIVLNTHEHVLTNPAVRMASQGGSVDWFRFWLQDYEDPNPAKAEQYRRWRDLRKMQAENEQGATTSQSALD